MKILSFAVVAILSSTVYANEAFTALDIDQNKAISMTEASSLSGLIARWKELDVNADNQLSSDEFEVYTKSAEQSVTPDIQPQSIELN
jgi:hypothetical protein